jgi:hypothetical protein
MTKIFIKYQKTNNTNNKQLMIWMRIFNKINKKNYHQNILINNFNG